MVYFTKMNKNNSKSSKNKRKKNLKNWYGFCLIYTMKIKQ
jgi:hypothetical protein